MCISISGDLGKARRQLRLGLKGRDLEFCVWEPAQWGIDMSGVEDLEDSKTDGGKPSRWGETGCWEIELSSFTPKPLLMLLNSQPLHIGVDFFG